MRAHTHTQSFIARAISLPATGEGFRRTTHLLFHCRDRKTVKLSPGPGAHTHSRTHTHNKKQQLIPLQKEVFSSLEKPFSLLGVSLVPRRPLYRSSCVMVPDSCMCARAREKVCVCPVQNNFTCNVRIVYTALPLPFPPCGF